MLQIKKIEIENFRGIKLPISINLKKGSKYTSAIIYGRNGTGKSSIVDAWEWFNSFEISGLKKEGVSNKDYPHKSSKGKNSFINAEFEHDSIDSIKIEFNPKKITSPKIHGEHSQFKKICKYPNYLRYSDLQDFVYKTKTDKYRYIAKFFGLDDFVKNQDTLLKFLNKQDALIQSIEQELNSVESDLQLILGTNLLSEIGVVSSINEIAQKNGFEKISRFYEAKGIKQKIEVRINNNPEIKALTELKAFQSKILKIYPLESLRDLYREVIASLGSLKHDEKNLTKLILERLYADTITILPQLDNPALCPICDKEFEDDLLEHVSLKHTSLKDLKSKKLEFERNKNLLLRKIQEIQKKVLILDDEPSPIIKSELETSKETFANLKRRAILFEKEIEILTVESDVPLDIDTSFLELIESAKESESGIKTTLKTKIEEIERRSKENTLATDHEKIIKLINLFFKYLVTSKKLEYLNYEYTNLNTIYDQLTDYIQRKIQTTFSEISKDVVECYNILESSNKYLKNPAIKLISGKNKAIELEIEFANEKISPAYKFMSESQVNSFGLSIFLAATKHFNNEFKFIILDDVINSFDNFKRPKVPQLLGSKFSDFQTLILTHDQIFFDTIQRDFPGWNRYKFVGWDYATGPKHRLAKNYIEEVNEFLEEDRPVFAGQTLGRYFEWIFVY
jgi:recombinational DNA repair ATPase RecF